MPLISLPMRDPNTPFEALFEFFKGQHELKQEHVIIEPLASSQHTDDPCWSWRITEGSPKLVDKGGRSFVQQEDGIMKDIGHIPVTSGVIIDYPEGWLVTGCDDDEEIEDQIEMVLGNTEVLFDR